MLRQEVQWPHRHVNSNLKESIARTEEALAPDKVETDLFAVASHGSTAGACVSTINT